MSDVKQKRQRVSDCTFHSIVSIYSCFCCGCDINMHSRRVPGGQLLFYAAASRRGKLRSVKGNKTHSRMDYDDYIAIIRASGAAYVTLNHFPDLCSDVRCAVTLTSTIELHLCHFRRLLMTRPSRFCARCIAGVLGCFFFVTYVKYIETSITFVWRIFIL